VVIPVVAAAVLIAVAWAITHWTITHAVVKVDGMKIGDFDALLDRPIEVTGNKIGVYDALLDLPLWEDVHESNVMVCVTAPWPKAKSVTYGLAADAPDGGTLFVRNFKTGKKMWSYRPAPPELAPVYARISPGKAGSTASGSSSPISKAMGKRNLSPISNTIPSI